MPRPGRRLCTGIAIVLAAAFGVWAQPTTMCAFEAPGSGAAFDLSPLRDAFTAFVTVDARDATTSYSYAICNDTAAPMGNQCAGPAGGALAWQVSVPSDAPAIC
jgi:hypothetical protein